MPGDIFISYARKDDRAPDLPGAQGFVASLHNQLLAVFEDRGPPVPTVFRDVKQIQSSDQFEPRLGGALRHARVMLVVLSRNWLAPEREWCHRELATFVELAKATGASDMVIRERIVVVRRHAVARDQHPEWLRGQSGYDLLDRDHENGNELPFFNAELGRYIDPRWLTTIGSLADDLRQRIAKVPTPSHPPEPGLSAEPNGRKLFVARPASDMRRSWEIIVEELTRRGFEVLPEPTLAVPQEAGDANDLFRTALSAADLSIHLLGEGEGFRPEGADPIVRLQLALAATRSQATDDPTAPSAFHRLIWAPRIPPGALDDTLVREPFAVLARHATPSSGAPPEKALQPGDKLHGDTLAKFVDFLVQHLALVAPRQVEATGSLEQGAEIYVEHHELDRAHALIVARSLRELGLKPALPAAQGEPGELAAWHRRNLKRCAGVVLCWARAGDVWVLAAADEHGDPSLGREQPFRSRAVVLLPPPDQVKTDADLLVESVGIKQLIDASGEEPTLQTLKARLQPLCDIGS